MSRTLSFLLLPLRVHCFALQCKNQCRKKKEENVDDHDDEEDDTDEEESCASRGLLIPSPLRYVDITA